QMRVYEEIVQANASTEFEIGQKLMVQRVEELHKSRESGDHSSGGHSSGDHALMLGPYRVYESRALPGLLAMVRNPARELVGETQNDNILPKNTMDIIQKGNQLVLDILASYADDQVEDKQMALDTILSQYLSDEELSLATRPKTFKLLSDHPFAYSFQTGFPQLAGFTWALQWLQLAALETLLDEARGNQAD